MVTKELYEHIDTLADALTNFHFNDDSVVILLADLEGYDRTGSINGPTLPTIVKLLEMMGMIMDGCSEEEKKALKSLITAAAMEM